VLENFCIFKNLFNNTILIVESFSSFLILTGFNDLHLIENTFDRKRISANPSSNPNSNPKAQ